jgi:hypothetical protein
MPKLTKEITEGHQFSRSSNGGQLADAQTRVFRVVLSEPGEVVNPETECQIRIGDPHPINSQVVCTSYDIKYEGAGRMVFLCTFQYQSSATSSGEENRNQPPDVRPANWSVSTSLMEMPIVTWNESDNNGVIGAAEPAANPVGDMYEGISRVAPVTTIVVEEFEKDDPTKYCEYVGVVNADLFRIGSLYLLKREVMFRGLQARPTVESWGGELYRGWTVSYEFVYRRNEVQGLYYEGQVYDDFIGWDIAVPQSGFNIINKSAALGGGIHEVGSLALAHSAEGKIANWPDDPDLVEGTEDKKVRGMVLVASYGTDGGASQLPCAQPIPLNGDGTPRSSTANPKVIVRRWCVHTEVSFADTFGHLRLQ